DQGEIISPLLWRIFYDPLLCKIQDNEKLGYTMQCTWQPNMTSQESNKLELHSAAIAYIDDTTWVSYSKQNLQMILEDAREFYLANNSQINSSKSVLLNINSTEKNDYDNNVQAGLNRDIVQRMNSKESTRFLGIWLSDKDPKKDTILRTQQEIDKITTALKNKKATDKQALYIFNNVLIPRIEYRTQICHISQQECDKLTRQCRKIFKNKVGICNTIPNSVIHHMGIYNLKNIWDVQLESQITGLIHRLNDQGLADKATLIRLKQAQIKNWEPENIFSEKIPNSFDYKGNFSATITKLASKLGFKFNNTNLEQLFQWTGGSRSIKTELKDDQLYYKSAQSLRKKRLMYIDQLIDAELNILLDWNFIKTFAAGSSKGRSPTWFIMLKEKITTNNKHL